MACLHVRDTHQQLNRMAGVSPSAKTFTPKQGQYLAFIHLYARLHHQPPAETDMQEYFCVSLPSVHQIVLTLERAGLIRRQPRTPRSIEVLVDPRNLPELLSPRPTCQLVALHRGFDWLLRQFSGCTAPAYPSLACGVDALKQRLYDIGRKFLEELDREARPRCALLKPRPPPRT